MPRLRRVDHPRLAPPHDLGDDEPVFVVSYAGEIFREYEYGLIVMGCNWTEMIELSILRHR